MKEYISKEEIAKIIQRERSIYASSKEVLFVLDLIEAYISEINSLPSIESLGYEIGQLVEFSEDWEEWFIHKFSGYGSRPRDASWCVEYLWKYIRPLQEEPDDLKQARLTLEKYGYTITKN